MIAPDWLRMMARFSGWRTARLIESCDALDDAARRLDRGLFFRSIHETIDHVLWADQVWLWRFGAADRPSARSIADSTKTHADWTALKAARLAFDGALVVWADGVDPGWLKGDLSWDSAAAGRRMTTPCAVAATHLFNHQAHHYGQIHAVLTQAGIKPADWDLAFAPLETRD